MTMFARLKKKKKVDRSRRLPASSSSHPCFLKEGRNGKTLTLVLGTPSTMKIVTWHNSSIRSPNANYHMTIHEASCIKKHPKRRIPEENFRAAETGRNSQERRSTFLFINNWHSFEGRLLAQKSLVLVLIYVSSTFHFPQTSHSSSRLFRS